VLHLGEGARELGLVNAATGTALVLFLLVGAIAEGIGARPVFALAGLGAAALMCVVFLVPGVRDYRAPPHPGSDPAGVPMLAGDRNDAR
jgi:hypothetical protein